MLYRILKGIVWLGVRLYYKETKIVNKEHLNISGPAVIIANHPNTLMDAWMMGYINHRRVHFMAKATFFSSPFKRKLLGALGMIPINRKSDGAVDGVSNKDSFEACYQLLERGEILVIFPEGTSYLERQLREIKSGTARIVLEVEARNGGNLGVKVIPVGLNYVNADSYRGKVLVSVGKPLSIDQDDMQRYQTSSGNAAKVMTEEFRVALSRVFVTLASSEQEEVAERVAGILDARLARGKKGVNQSIELLKRIAQRLDEFQVVSPYRSEEIKALVEKMEAKMKGYSIRPDFLTRNYRPGMFVRQMVQSSLFLTLTFPLFIVGYLQNLLPYWGIGKLVPKLSKEVEYHAPLAILLGFVCYPLMYVLWILLAHYGMDLRGWWLVAFGIQLPLTGTFAHFYLRYWKHIGSKRKYSRFMKKHRGVFDDLVKERSQLNDLIFND